jgi:competence ComEA-like helix-hairpin-helix protein
MDQGTTYRGPLGFTPAESKVAVGLAVIVLLFSLIAVYQRLVRPAPHYSFHTYVVGSSENTELPGPESSGPQLSEVSSQQAVAVQGLLNINTADYADLVRLPGIGPVLAGRIMAYRDRHGPFTVVDSLIHVSGIGAVKLEKIRLLVIVH